MMECKYKIITENRSLCLHPNGPSLFACNEECCTYLKEKQEEEFRKNPPPSTGWRYCPYMRPDLGFQCSIYLNDCSTCGLNPAVKEQREKELAEQKRLKEESKLSYKIKRFFKKERKG